MCQEACLSVHVEGVVVVEAVGSFYGQLRAHLEMTPTLITHRVLALGMTPKADIAIV